RSGACPAITRRSLFKPMKPLSLQDVRGAVSGKGLTPLPDTFGPILNICTDTRAMSPSSVFVALKGDTLDGSQFVVTAAAGGGILAVVQDKPANIPDGMYVVQV